MLLMKDGSFLYELRGYLIYVKVGERNEVTLHTWRNLQTAVNEWQHFLVQY